MAVEQQHAMRSGSYRSPELKQSRYGLPLARLNSGHHDSGDANAVGVKEAVLSMAWVIERKYAYSPASRVLQHGGCIRCMSFARPSRALESCLQVCSHPIAVPSLQ